MKQPVASSLLQIFSCPHDLVLRPMRARGDRIMAYICWLLLVVSMSLAPAYGTWRVWTYGAVPLALTATLLAWKFAGSVFTRMAMAVIFMSFAAISIHQFHGLIEMHFSVFVLLAFLLYYRDWRPILAAAVAIAAHHFALCELQMRGWPIFVFPQDHLAHGCDMVWVHAAFVVFESGCLIYIGQVILKEAVESAAVSALGMRIAQHGSIDFDNIPMGSHTTAQATWSSGLQQFMQAIRGAVGGAGAVAGRIGDVSLQMTEAAAHMFEQGSAQNGATTAVLATVHSMSEATGEITGDCEEVGRVVHASKDILHTGRQSMAQAVALMHTLGGSVAGVAQQIDDLHRESERIESIIRVISDIADQTTLLAFNATIEAARAGDAGTGFAVVAREVRDLSSRTMVSLADAQAVVNEVRSRTAAARTAADRCREDATLGGVQVTEADIALAGIAERLPEIVQRTAKVLRVAREHGQLAEDVVRQLSCIGEAVGTSSADLSRFEELSRGLRDMAGELGASVRQFRAA